MTRSDAATLLDELLGTTVASRAETEGDVPEVDPQVGRRARVARRRAGLDAATVAAAIGLTPDKFSKLENGRRRVAPRELPALARALSVSVASLMGAPEAPHSALALAHRVAASADRETATSQARDRAVALLEAEDRLARTTSLPERQLSPAGAAVGQHANQQYTATPRTRPEAIRQGRALADEVRKQLELGVAEIGDLPALIEMNFAADVALSPLGEGSDGLCAREGEAVLLVVNTDFPMGRTRFTLAHELGHHLLSDARGVIEENQGDMNAKSYSERRVNSFAAHLLLPTKAVLTTLAWLSATEADISSLTARGRRAIGYLMVHYGVSLPCTLGQLVDAGYLTTARKDELIAELDPEVLVRSAAPLISERPSPHEKLRERRPPARLASVVIEAARKGAVGMNTVAAVLDRPDDERLFDEVMFGALELAAV
jgi:Zn-dependent peptidase ImmA (M78 family)/transcriptional regulator with XRE-family HTH domain